MKRRKLAALVSGFIAVVLAVVIIVEILTSSEKTRLTAEADNARERVEELTEAQMRLQKAVEGGQLQIGIVLGGVEATIEFGSQPSMQTDETDTLVRVLKEILARQQLGGSEFADVELLEIQIGNATIALAEARYSDALQELDTQELRQEHSRTAVNLERELRTARISGSAHYGLRDWQSALVDFNRVLALDNANTNARFYIATCLAELGMLDDALLEIDKVVDQYSRDPKSAKSTTSLRQLAAAHTNRGLILYGAGRLEDAMNVFARSNEVLDEVDEEQHPTTANDIANNLTNQGFTLAALGRLREAIDVLDEAIHLRSELLSKSGAWQLRSRLASSYANRGNVFAKLAMFDQAVNDHTVAIETYDELVEAHGRKELAETLVGCYLNRANTLEQMARYEAALADYAIAIDTVAELASDGQRQGPRVLLALCRSSRAVALAGCGDINNSLVDHEAAIASLGTLVDVEGRNDLRDKLASCFAKQGNTLKNAGMLGAAIESHTRAVEIYEKLVKVEQRFDLKDELAACLTNRGIALGRTGIKAESDADHTRAIDIYENLIAEHGREDLQAELAACLTNRGHFSVEKNLGAGRSDDHSVAIAILSRQVESGRPDLRNQLATAHASRGDALSDAGRPEEAARDYSKAIEVRTHLIDGEGRHELWNNLASSFNNRGIAFRQTENAEAAVNDYDRAISIRERLVHGDQRDDLKSDLAKSLYNRGNALFADLHDEERAASDYEGCCEILAPLVNEQGQVQFTYELVNSLNSLAWIRATSPVAAQRNGPAAVQLATRACELTNWRNWSVLDSLAAAYAEVGDFESATIHLQDAQRLAPRDVQGESKIRLELYEEKKPFHRDKAAHSW